MSDYGQNSKGLRVSEKRVSRLRYVWIEFCLIYRCTKIEFLPSRRRDRKCHTHLKRHDLSQYSVLSVVRINVNRSFSSQNSERTLYDRFNLETLPN